MLDAHRAEEWQRLGNRPADKVDRQLLLLGTDKYLVHLVQLVSGQFVLCHHRQAVFAIGHEEALPRIVKGLEDDEASFDGELFTNRWRDFRFKGVLA